MKKNQERKKEKTENRRERDGERERRNKTVLLLFIRFPKGFGTLESAVFFYVFFFAKWGKIKEQKTFLQKN